MFTKLFASGGGGGERKRKEKPEGGRKSQGEPGTDASVCQKNGGRNWAVARRCVSLQAALGLPFR